MSFCTAENLLDKVKDILKAEGPVPDYWTSITADANAWAYQQIVSTWSSRGFNKAQIDAWDYGADWQRQLGLWKSFQKGGGLAGYDDKFIKTLDVREEFAELGALMVGGEWEAPLTPVDQVTYGSGETVEEIQW